MQAELEKYDVSVVALSKDTVEEAAVHKARDGLTFQLLSDPKLEVIKQYGVEHHKAFGFKTGLLVIGGIPLAFVPSFKAMAIPTSLLVDEHGVIQWIDQTDDYRLRSNDSRVLGAVKNAFG
jgi:alkyl hydroperoxide reductase subunit AhpC